jgi:hypothetical protein
MNMVFQAHLHESLGCHRSVVGEEAGELGAGAMQALVRLVEHAGLVCSQPQHGGVLPAVARFVTAAIG